MDVNNDFFIIRGYHHPHGRLYATKVFEEDKNGDRINENGLRYKKVVRDKIISLEKSLVIKHFKPRKAKVKENLSGIWKEIFDYLTKINVPKRDIGIFGSTLIGFPAVKDVDFIIYGLDNLKKVKANIRKLKNTCGFSDISKEHIAYQSKKYSNSQNINFTNFNKTLQNKWSSLQIKKGLLMTIRFGLKDHEISPAFKVDLYKKGKEICVEGRVMEDIYTNLCPRIFKIKSRNKTYIIKTLFWAYQSCVKDKDLVLIRGEKINNTIILKRYNHGVIIKDKLYK